MRTRTKTTNTTTKKAHKETVDERLNRIEDLLKTLVGIVENIEKSVYKPGQVVEYNTPQEPRRIFNRVNSMF